MAFVLEELTDEQREQMGFAKTSDEVRGFIQRRGLHFVHAWSIDRERNAYLVATMKGANSWNAELQWQNEAIHIIMKALVGHDVPEELRKREEGKTGRYIRVFFEVSELLIPESLKDKLPEIKQMIKDGLEGYGWGIPWRDHLGYAYFSPQLEIRFPKFTKSKIKLIDFEPTH